MPCYATMRVLVYGATFDSATQLERRETGCRCHLDWNQSWCVNEKTSASSFCLAALHVRPLQVVRRINRSDASCDAHLDSVSSVRFISFTPILHDLSMQPSPGLSSLLHQKVACKYVQQACRLLQPRLSRSLTSVVSPFLPSESFKTCSPQAEVL